MTKYNFKKTPAGIFAAALVASSIPLAPYTKVLDGISISTSAADIVTGSCGDDTSFVFDPETGLLTISGTGAIAEDAFNTNVEPYGLCLDIKEVVIDNGITEVGPYAFYDCDPIQNITIPDSVTILGEGAFEELEITSITFECSDPDAIANVSYITPYQDGCPMFEFCSNLQAIYVPIGCKALYEASPGYQTAFGDKIELIQEKDTDHIVSFDTGEMDVSIDDVIVKDGRKASAGEQPEVPRIYITTANGNGLTLQKADDYVAADFVVCNTDAVSEAYDGSIKVRGNTTAKGEKKPYTIRFNKKVDLLGMGKAKKWCLLANCFDPTMLRNYLAFDTAKHMGLEFTSEMQFVEVWMDDEYEGCYLLTEPIEVKETRIDIDTEANDGLGDFLLEFEGKRSESDRQYIEIDTLRYAVKEPKQPTDVQMQYMTDTMQRIITKLQSHADFQSVLTEIDLTSFAKYYWMCEIYKNTDIGYSSAFVYYRNGKLYAGPVWDYDLNFGNVNPDYSINYVNCAKPEELYANKQIFLYLLEYSEFIASVRQIALQYDDFYGSIAEENGYLDTVSQQYASVFQRNFERWDISKTYCTYMRKPDSTYAENLNTLKNWFAARKDWLYSYYHCCELPLGDVNGDGIVTIADAVQLLSYVNENALSGTASSVCASYDTNADGIVSIQDVCKVLQMLEVCAEDQQVSLTE